MTSVSSFRAAAASTIRLSLTQRSGVSRSIISPVSRHLSSSAKQNILYQSPKRSITGSLVRQRYSKCDKHRIDLFTAYTSVYPARWLGMKTEPLCDYFNCTCKSQIKPESPDRQYAWTAMPLSAHFIVGCFFAPLIAYGAVPLLIS